MDMPVSVEVVDKSVRENDIEKVFTYFRYVDNTFSTFKKNSEISKINRGEIEKKDYSLDIQNVLTLCDKTKDETDGYFNIRRKGELDPSGLVKGWAILRAAKILKESGYKNYYIEAGGDIEMSGKNSLGNKWTIGIRNPFNRKENIKIISVTDCGVATSGTYIRGQHIYNPLKPNQNLTEIVSLTVIGPDIYEADRFATAAFAMGKKGIYFIEGLKNFEGYMIDKQGIATYTSSFDRYVIS